MKKFIFKNIPNILSILRIILVILVFIMFIKEKYIIAIILLIVAALTDFFDGKIARKYNLCSKTGRLLDGAADKIFELGIAILIIIKGNYLFLITIFLELVIIAIHIIYLAKGKKWIKPLYSGKVRMWFFFSLQILSLIYIVYPSFYIYYIILLILTGIIQIYCIYDYYKFVFKK